MGEKSDDDSVEIKYGDKSVEMPREHFIDMVVEYDRCDKTNDRFAHNMTHKLGLSGLFEKLYKLVWCPSKAREDGGIGGYTYRRRE